MNPYFITSDDGLLEGWVMVCTVQHILSNFLALPAPWGRISPTLHMYKSFIKVVCTGPVLILSYPLVIFQTVTLWPSLAIYWTFSISFLFQFVACLHGCALLSTEVQSYFKQLYGLLNLSIASLPRACWIFWMVSAQGKQKSKKCTLKMQEVHTTHLYSRHNSQELRKPCGTKIFTHALEGWCHLPPKGSMWH